MTVSTAIYLCVGGALGSLVTYLLTYTRAYKKGYTDGVNNERASWSHLERKGKLVSVDMEV